MRDYNTILIKPSSHLCNMKCKYCFYVDENNNRTKKYGNFMDNLTCENILMEFISNTSKCLSIVFQGGEPLLVGIEFYHNFIETVNRINKDKIKIEYSIQTNGLLIDDEFAKFFSENKFLVGVSIDGTKEIHDKYRIDNSSDPTYDKTVNATKILDKFNVDYNILTVVSKDIANSFEEIYKNYRNLNFRYVQYIPLIDNINDIKGSKNYSLDNKHFLNYLKKSFDYWYDDILNNKRWYHRYFDSLLNRIGTNCYPECTMDSKCGIMYSIESNGDVFPCDFYMTDRYLLGNINSNSIQEIDDKRTSIEFCKEHVTSKCKKCNYYMLCMGGCKRDKIKDQNYYCDSFYKFFEYSLPKYKVLLDLIRQHKI